MLGLHSSKTKVAALGTRAQVQAEMPFLRRIYTQKGNFRCWTSRLDREDREHENLPMWLRNEQLDMIFAFCSLWVQIPWRLKPTVGMGRWAHHNFQTHGRWHLCAVSNIVSVSKKSCWESETDLKTGEDAAKQQTLSGFELRYESMRSSNRSVTAPRCLAGLICATTGDGSFCLYFMNLDKEKASYQTEISSKKPHGGNGRSFQILLWPSHFLLTSWEGRVLRSSLLSRFMLGIFFPNKPSVCFRSRQHFFLFCLSTIALLFFLVFTQFEPLILKCDLCVAAASVFHHVFTVVLHTDGWPCFPAVFGERLHSAEATSASMSSSPFLLLECWEVLREQHILHAFSERHWTQNSERRKIHAWCDSSSCWWKYTFDSCSPLHQTIRFSVYRGCPNSNFFKPSHQWFEEYSRRWWGVTTMPTMTPTWLHQAALLARPENDLIRTFFQSLGAMEESTFMGASQGSTSWLWMRKGNCSFFKNCVFVTSNPSSPYWNCKQKKTQAQNLVVRKTHTLLSKFVSSSQFYLLCKICHSREHSLPGQHYRRYRVQSGHTPPSGLPDVSQCIAVSIHFCWFSPRCPPSPGMESVFGSRFTFPFPGLHVTSTFFQSR